MPTQPPVVMLNATELALVMDNMTGDGKTTISEVRPLFDRLNEAWRELMTEPVEVPSDRVVSQWTELTANLTEDQRLEALLDIIGNENLSRAVLAELE